MDAGHNRLHMLNRIWAFFFFAAFFVGLVKWLALGDAEVFPAMVQSTFDMAGVGFEIALGLTGVMCLWLGVMKLGEAGGAVDLLARLFRPLMRRLFPGIPPGHPATGAIVMNMAANMLGLDNAATPLGLKAMKELQTLNPEKERASDDQILFLVINTSAVTLIPITIFVYRAQLGAADPTDVFIPLLVATFCSTMVGLVVTALVQRIRLWDPVVLAYLGGMTALVAGMVLYFASLPRDVMERQSTVLSNVLIFTVIIAFLALAARRRAPVYETFVEGAKEGFQVAVQIIPFLVAMLVAIGVFRASGTLDLILDGVRYWVQRAGLDSRWVDGLPTALMRPLSGSGARGLMLETMETLGADSFAGRLVSIIQGSTETTFYVLAVYFGSVGIKDTRHAAPCGLAADLGGILGAIFVAYLFFG
jgi:spore maturation protein SpmA